MINANRPLPRCPAPKCVQCQRPLTDIRPYRADQPHARMYLVHVLSRCAACQTPHIGVRVLLPVFGGPRFIKQTIERYTPERRAELELVAEFLSRGEHPAQLHQDLPLPAEPEYALWFENTLADPERVAPQPPAPGFPIEAWEVYPGALELERRLTADGTHLTGTLLRFANASAAADALAEIQARSKRLGTLAWIRRFDVPEYKAAWDTHTPAPGNAYVSILERPLAPAKSA